MALSPEGYKAFRLWVERQIQTLTARSVQETMQLVAQTEVPKRPRDGLLVWADGDNWDPGGGEGLYFFRAGVWHPIVSIGE